MAADLALVQELIDYPRSLRAIKRLREGTPADRLEAMANVKQWMPKRINDLMWIAPDGSFLNSDGKTGGMVSGEDKGKKRTVVVTLSTEDDGTHVNVAYSVKQ